MRIQEKYYKYIWAVVFVLIGVLSFTFIHDLYLNWGFTKYAISYLDNKANTVLGLTGASTSASVAITLVPGDVGTPIASQLANISSYSVIILAAVHLEKYLITLAAVICLRILIPVAMALAVVDVLFLNNFTVNMVVKKICTFALALVFVIPASVALSTLIENTYKDDVQISIEETEREAETIKQTLQEKDQNLWNQFLSAVGGETMQIVGKFENSLNNFVEAISVMLITSCVIPALTFAVLTWLIKAVFQINFRTPNFAELSQQARMDPYRIRGNRNDRKEIEYRNE